MYFVSLSLVAAALVATVVGQSTENPFQNREGFMIRAGEPTTVNWDPTTQGPVTIKLRSGASSDLNRGVAVAENIPNSGSYTFTVPEGTTRNSDYTLSIAPVSDPTEENYTPQFVVESSNTVATTTGDSSASTAATSTGSRTSSPSGTSTATSATSSNTRSTTSSGTSTATSSGTSTATSSGTSTATSSGTSTATSSRSSSSGSSSSSVTASDESIAASAPTSNAASALNVQGGMAAVILGAMAIL